MPQRFRSTADSSNPSCHGGIGIFDSGVGGLSVLRSLHMRLPRTSMDYVGDVAFAPYGERPAAEIIQRCERIVEHLIGQGARLIVVACNTATVTAIRGLRERWPEMPFVGVEPGVRPAAAQSPSKRIAVMTTPATAASARLRELIVLHAEGVHVHVQACPGLANAIEHGVLGGAELQAVLAEPCERIRAARVDTVVLGCTHYPFVANAIREMLGPHVTIVDTAAAVAERAASLMLPAETVGDPQRRICSTGPSATMQLLMARCAGFEGIEIEALDV